MSKVIFSIKYNIIKGKREKYLDVVRELKNLIKSDDLDSYSVYELKGSPNSFKEIYVYKNQEAWENADNDPDERIDALMSKLSELIESKSTCYSTLFEVES